MKVRQEPAGWPGQRGGKELGKASLCIKARCEKEGARAIVILTELRICTALLKEEGHQVEDILCERLLSAKRPRREDQDIEAGCKKAPG